MAGGHMKYRHLSRSSSHRQALLRNLVTSLFKHDQIKTTWHKAKEAQRMADKVVTLAKRNTPAAMIRAQQIFYTPHEILGKLFTEIRERYADRPGGYTRVLRIESMKEDQADSAILELVDSPKDMRFALTAKTVALMRREKQELNEITRKNVAKVTRYRSNGKEALENMVKEMSKVNLKEQRGQQEPTKKLVYPDHMARFRTAPGTKWTGAKWQERAGMAVTDIQR